jgi:hypothetical protein
MGYTLAWGRAYPGMGKFAKFWENYVWECGKYDARSGRRA